MVLGAGGAARAVLVALGELGVAQVEVLNRRPLRADRMLATIDCESVQLRVLPSVDEARGRYEMVINATTLGLHAGDRLPLPLSGFDTGSVFDCVYGRGGTAWTRHAEAVGLPAMDGLEMLIEQARLSIGNWVGRLPPVRAMREAATGALGG